MMNNVIMLENGKKNLGAQHFNSQSLKNVC